jgi:methyl-accepting chemotaxis protein PixJ
MTMSFRPEITTLADFADLLAEIQTSESGNGGSRVPISEPDLRQPEPAAHLDEKAKAFSDQEFLQVANALSELKSELQQAGVLQKPNVKQLFLQITGFVAALPKTEQTLPASQLFRYQRQQLLAIANQMHQAKDAEALLETVVKAVRKVLQVDRVLIYRFSSASEGRIVAESIQRGWTPALGKSLAATCFGEDYAERYVAQQAVTVDDSSKTEISPYQQQLLEQLQVKASLSLPVVLSQPWGLLVVQQCSKSRQWQEAETSLLHQVALELTIHLQRLESLSKVRQQAIRENAVVKVIGRIRQSLDLDAILKSTVREVRQLLKADRVGVFRFYPESGFDDGEFVAEDVQAGFSSAIAAKIHDHCFGQQYAAYYTQGRIQAVADIHNAGLSDCHIEVLAQFDVRANLIVPLLKGNELWGLLCIHQCAEPRQWQETEIEFVKQIAAQFCVALQQAELLEQVQAQSKQLTRIAEQEKAVTKVIGRIRQSLDLDAILKSTVREVRQLLKADRVGVFRFYPESGFDDGEFVAEDVQAGFSSAIAAKIHDHCFGQQYAAYYTQGRIQAVADIHNAGLSDCHIEVLAQFDVRANLIVPLLKGNELWGLLCIHQCAEPRQWQETEIEFVKQIAAQFCVALQQAELLEQVQAQSKQLTRIAEQEKTLVRVTDRIRQSIDVVYRSLDINFIFQVTTQEVRQLLKVDRVALYRFNPDWSGDFVAESVSSGWIQLVGTEIGTNVRDTYLRETQGGRYRNGEHLAVDDIHQAGHDPCHVDLLEKFEAKAYVLVPVFVERKLWGLLCAYQNSASRHWEELELSLLNQIALQVGFALDQLEFLEQLRGQSEQLAKAAAREKAAKELLQQRVIQLLAAVKPVFSGDLTVRVPVTEDEVGTIADAYNNTIQSLRKIVTQVQTATTQVAQTSQKSETAIAELSQQAQQQLQDVTQALDRIQTMINSTQAVAANAKQVEAAVQQANQTVQAGDTAMNRTVEGILAIRETVAETSKKIKHLSESSQKISKVVSLISNFTTQTQLLALNASIEATRAGEYGRGFTVVADEVRSLSRQSADATREIEKLVQEIQTEISEATNAMDLGIQQVVGGTTLVNDTRQQLNEIVAATAQISRLVQGITQATQAQTQQSQRVTQAISDVAAIAQKTSTDSKQISTSFQELLTTAQQLQISAGQFKVN